MLEKFRQYLIGQDPFRIEHHWQYMYRSMYFRGSIIMSAISAIDIALWDIKGKALGVPVYELLGGKCRDKVRSYGAVVPVYAGGYGQGLLELKEQGFTAARLMITGGRKAAHHGNPGGHLQPKGSILCGQGGGLPGGGGG